MAPISEVSCWALATGRIFPAPTRLQEPVGEPLPLRVPAGVWQRLACVEPVAAVWVAQPVREELLLEARLPGPPAVQTPVQPPLAAPVVAVLPSPVVAALAAPPARPTVAATVVRGAAPATRRLPEPAEPWQSAGLAASTATA